MLSSPTHVVIGSADLAASERFLAVFGFETVAEGILEAATARQLYGHEVACRELVMAAPGASRGWLRLVETPGRYAPPEPRDPRSLAVVVETRDLDRSLARGAAAGVTCGKPVTDALRNVREAVAESPGNPKLLLRQAASEDGLAQPSLLRRLPDRLHSEVAGVLWSVQTFSTVNAFWGRSGLGLDVEEAYVAAQSAAIVQTAELDGNGKPFPYRKVADPQGMPLCLELLEVGDPVWLHRPTWPLALGIHAVAFEVASLRPIRRRLQDAAFCEVVAVDSAVHVKSHAVSLRAPGRVRFELWQEETPYFSSVSVN